MNKLLHIILLAMAFVTVGVFGASAFDLSLYAAHSALGSGRWVKVSVTESGLYRIPAATLRQWGFTDPSRVSVHGYGGRRIDNKLTAEGFADDLPATMFEADKDGVVFYAEGPDTWETDDGRPTINRNPYTERGYYYVTMADSAVAAPAVKTGTPGERPGAMSTGTLLVQHERELTQACESGPLFVGESLTAGNTAKLTFKLPRYTAGDDVDMVTQIIANTPTAATVSYTLNGSDLPVLTTDRVPATAASSYVHASYARITRVINPDKAEFSLGVSLSGRATRANLDFVALSYRVPLTVASGEHLVFLDNARASVVRGAVDEMRIWDVTDPQRVMAVDFAVSDGTAAWTQTELGRRRYAVWTPTAKMPAPKYEGVVAAQDLHGLQVTPELVIFHTKALRGQAERIAELHRTTEGMEVETVDVDLVYNEFSSGSPDVSGLRKFLKLRYDRGAAAGKPLRYALLLGRATLDHRGIVKTGIAADYITLPAWVVPTARQSMSDNDGYMTDDFLGMLADDGGDDMGIDDISVAVGRIPMTSVAEGAEVVDKLYQYVRSSKRTGWKNKVLMLADDGDNGIHLRQTETTVSNFMATPNQQHLIKKVYMDAYELTGGEYPGARSDMFRWLDEGVVWWYFTGHANNHSWTGEHQLTFTDINNMYLRYIPFVVASTCDFLRWDSPTMSGGEIMYKERYGGCIGMISATRPVYISDNGLFLAALGRATLSRDSDGRLLTAGEVYRRAKNNILGSDGNRRSNYNRLRFVFMGDPAMRIVTPDNIVETLTIDGMPAAGDEQITIPAMGQTVVTGRILAYDGSPMTDFDGVVSVELYDAQRSVTTRGNGDEGSIEVFDTEGDKLFAGSAPVKGGEFSLKISMPPVVADNFRPATMSFYAYATNSNAEAVGTNRDFYVYGFREPEKPDTEAPVIERMVLNHEGFESGDAVNPSPMLIAHVSDNMGLNLSVSGIGQSMTLQLDDMTTMTDVSFFYTPDADGNPGGVINYPLENLAEGAHSLRLRVFDTSGNHVSRTIDFNVTRGLAPQIFDVYTDANPASTAANFYIRHDRPELVATVTVGVYDLMGRQIWTNTRKGMSDHDVSAPVTWDLTDGAGRRVNRGIYLYRATITTDNETFETSSRRIAVTAE